jgi:hypothetical protein
LKKKFILIITSICLLVIATVAILIYRGYASAKSLSDYKDVATPYKKTMILPIADLKNLEINDSLTLQNGTILTRITYEEYLRMLDDSEYEYTDEMKPESATKDNGAYSYYYNKVAFGLDGSDECEFQAQLESVIILDNTNINNQIVDAFPVKTSLAAGPNNCVWIQSAVDRFITIKYNGQPLNEIELFGRGYFDLKFDIPFIKTCGWASPTLYMVCKYQCA